MNTPLALLGLPSVSDVIENVASKLWGAIADSLIPDELKDASARFLSWLVAVPNPAGSAKYASILQLQEYTMALAIAVLGLVSVSAAARYMAVGWSGNGDVGQVIGRIVAAMFFLVTYKWLFTNATALVNTITQTVFTWPQVKTGTAELTKTMFGVGSLGTLPIGGLFGIIGFLVLLMLLAVKLALTVVIAVLFVAGPLAIAVWPLPELESITRGWGEALGNVLAVPLMWTFVFAVAGVFVRDLPALLGLTSAGMPTVLVRGILTPLFTLIVLWIAFRAGTNAFSSLKLTFQTASITPGRSGSAVGAFAAGTATSEGRSFVRKAIRSGSGGSGGGAMLRQTLLASGGAAAGGAAGAAVVNGASSTPAAAVSPNGHAAIVKSGDRASAANVGGGSSSNSDSVRSSRPLTHTSPASDSSGHAPSGSSAADTSAAPSRVRPTPAAAVVKGSPPRTGSAPSTTPEVRAAGSKRPSASNGDRASSKPDAKPARDRIARAGDTPAAKSVRPAPSAPSSPQAVSRPRSKPRVRKEGS